MLGFSTRKLFTPGSFRSDDLQLDRPTVSPLLSFLKRISLFQSGSLRFPLKEKKQNSKKRRKVPLRKNLKKRNNQSIFLRLNIGWRESFGGYRPGPFNRIVTESEL